MSYVVPFLFPSFISRMSWTNVMSLWRPPKSVAFIIHSFVLLLDSVTFSSIALQPVDIKSRWRHNWKSAQVVNSHLVWPLNLATGFRPPLAIVVSAEPFSYKTVNRFRTKRTLRCLQKEMATCSADLCPCGETQTMRHIVENLSSDKAEWRLILAALCRWRRFSWLTYYEKKKIRPTWNYSASVALPMALYKYVLWLWLWLWTTFGWSFFKLCIP